MRVLRYLLGEKAGLRKILRKSNSYYCHSVPLMQHEYARHGPGKLAYTGSGHRKRAVRFLFAVGSASGFFFPVKARGHYSLCRGTGFPDKENACTPHASRRSLQGNVLLQTA